MKKNIIFTFALTTVLISSVGWAENTTSSNENVNKDNSMINKRDQNPAAVTADKQADATKSDVEMTREIRRALTKDKALSVYAHNIKIITLDGQVTLRGPVKSEEERAKIGKIANKIVGTNYAITNQLEIKR